MKKLQQCFYKICDLVTAMLVILFTASVASCASKSSSAAGSSSSVNDSITVPKVDGDSAFAYVQAQVDLGPRPTGSPANVKCQEFIKNTLHRHKADTVIEQKANVKTWDGKMVPINNILAQYNKDAKTRVLLLAHYDTRPVADRDPDPANQSKPILGANDGGSGVGVLLEIARKLADNRPGVGVDLLFVDAEDLGTDEANIPESEEGWCLGSQYWSNHLPYDASNKPKYGILLDMVGGSFANFVPEYFSSVYAPDVVNKVWSRAEAEGFTRYFTNSSPTGGIIDDHYYINKGGIPCIDIIEAANGVTKSFPPYWHTMGDNMDIIDRDVLEAVGQTVLSTVFHEPSQPE